MGQVTIPPIKQGGASFGLLRADSALEMMTGRDVITEFLKAVWLYQPRLVILEESEARAWTGALARLSRISNYFEATPPGYPGAAHTGALTVAGANQLGNAMAISGAANTTVLRAGEYFEAGGELKIVVADCVTDGGGAATVEFEPPLRESPASSSALNTQTPKARFRLINPQQSWSIQPGRLYSITIDCVEVLD